MYKRRYHSIQHLDQKLNLNAKKVREPHSVTPRYLYGIVYFDVKLKC